MPNEEHVDAAIRKLFEETGMALTVDDLTRVSDAVIRVPLHECKCKLVYEYAASVHVPYMKANHSAPINVEQAAISQSSYTLVALTSFRPRLRLTIYHDAGCYGCR
jgi:ADP-ribose pyrophosphatase YjhB (NUDIX family)